MNDAKINQIRTPFNFKLVALVIIPNIVYQNGTNCLYLYILKLKIVAFDLLYASCRKSLN